MQPDLGLPDDLTEVRLRPHPWSMLVAWCNRDTAHTKHGDKGAELQARRVRWRERLNHREHSILLTSDDRNFIARQITNRNAGGFEVRVANIFEDAHPDFTGLQIRPKKR